MDRPPTVRFDPRQAGMRSVLGDLEAEIMEIVWSSELTTVREVHDQLAPVRPVAYTTVMTVMNRLADKGLLERRREGAAHQYRAAASKEEFTARTVRNVLAGLLTSFARPTLSQLVDLAHDDPELIAELESLVAEGAADRDD